MCGKISPANLGNGTQFKDGVSDGGVGSAFSEYLGALDCVDCLYWENESRWHWIDRSYCSKLNYMDIFLLYF